MEGTMEQCQLERWEGKATSRLATAGADLVWSLLSDFCSLHLWLPGLHTCRLITGADGQPSCVRYCAAGTCDGEPVHWAYEELLEFDTAGRSYTYRVAENSMGLERYGATLRVVPPAPEEEEESGCWLEWAFESDPSEGWTREGLLAYLQAALEVMADRLEQATASYSSSSSSSSCSPAAAAAAISSSDGEVNIVQLRVES